MKRYLTFKGLVEHLKHEKKEREKECKKYRKDIIDLTLIIQEQQRLRHIIDSIESEIDEINDLLKWTITEQQTGY